MPATRRTPTVTFADTGSGTGAHAIAATDFGAVIALHLLTAGTGYVTPGGIKKFVDTLPGLTEAGANNLGQYIPLAVARHDDVPERRLLRDRGRPASRADELEPARAGTLLREYVQLVDAANVPGKHVALVQDNLDGPT